MIQSFLFCESFITPNGPICWQKRRDENIMLNSISISIPYSCVFLCEQSLHAHRPENHLTSKLYDAILFYERPQRHCRPGPHRRMRLCVLAAMLRFIDAPPPTSPSHTFTCFARMCLHVRMWVVFNTDTQVWGRMEGILLSCNSRQWIYIHKYTRSVGDFYAVSEHLKSMKHVHRCLYMYTYIEYSALIWTFCITSTTPNMWLLFPLDVRS